MSTRIPILTALILAVAAAAAGEEAEPLRGRVVGPDGEPVAGARVSTSFSAVVSETDRATAVRPDGSFRLENVPRGRGVRVWASAPGFGLGRTARIPGEADGVLIVRLPRAAVVRGRVTRAGGEPMEGARLIARGTHRGLALSPPETRTDAEGRYAFSSLPSGEWKVAAVADGRAPAARTGIELEAGGTRSGVDFALVAGRRLEGRVVDAEGHAVASEPLRVRSVGFPVTGVARARTRTDGEGRFSIRHLPDLPLVLTIGSERVADARQEVHPDESPVTLRVERLGHLSGRVALPDGRAHGEEMTVYVMPTGATTPYPTWIAPSPLRRVRPGPDDGVRLRGFRPGVYDVIALAEGGRVSNRVNDVRVGPGVTTEIGEPLILAHTGRIEGRVLDAAGEPVGGAEVALRTPGGEPAGGWRTRDRSGASTGGRFRLSGIHPGRYVLRAKTADDREAEIDVRVVAGETRQAELRVE